MTEWRTLSWLPGYEISEDGFVRTTVRRTSGRKLQGWLSCKGYRCYTLRRPDGRKGKTYVHRLVCEAWHGPCPPDKDQVAHADGNKLNNHYTNLRWSDARENTEDKLRHGTMSRKLTGPVLKAIRKQFANGTRNIELARHFGLSPASITKATRSRLRSELYETES